jgi:hypothetical protein
MFQLDLKKLTPEQRAMVALWEQHLKAEFQDRNAAASCDTMVPNPYVNHVPVMTGGMGRRQLEHFYGKYFIPGMPAIWKISREDEPTVTRVIGFLQHQSDYVRTHAARVLGEIGSPAAKALPALRNLSAKTGMQTYADAIKKIAPNN